MIFTNFANTPWQDATWALARLPGASKVRFGQVFWTWFFTNFTNTPWHGATWVLARLVQVKVRFGQVFKTTKKEKFPKSASQNLGSRLWTYAFSVQRFSFLGQVKFLFGQVFSIRFIIYLPEWVCDENSHIAPCFQAESWN